MTRDAFANICDIAQIHPDKPAIRTATANLSYRELVQRVERLAAAVRGSGISQGHKVGVICHDPIEDLCTKFALIKLGASPCSLDPSMAPETRLGVMKTYDWDLILECESCRSDAQGTTAMTSDWLSAGDLIDESQEVIANKDCQYYTCLSSGTTGTPTAIMTSLKSLSQTAELFNFEGLMSKDTVFLSQAPHFTSAGAGLPLIVLMLGGTALLRDDVRSLSGLIEVVKSEHVTVLFTVPSVASVLVRQALDDVTIPLLSSVSALLLGTDYCSVELLSDAAHYLCPRVVLAYGSTTTGIVTFLHATDFERKAGSVGRACRGVDLEIVDEEDLPVSTNTVGRIRVSSGMIPQAIAGPKRLDSEGLRHGYAYPGDVGRLDEEGFLYVLGREIDVIFDGKRKFYPNEMERALNRCEGFQDVAIVGIPLGDNLKVPVAFTVLLPGVSRSDLVTSAASSLNAEHLPYDIVILDTLPRNQLGKVVRRALADGYVVPEQSIFDARGTEAVKMGLTLQ